jgi:K+ transporter
MERPTLAPILKQCEIESLDLEKPETSFVYANPLIVRAQQDALPRWQRALFAWLQRNSRSLATELEIPANRRVELSVEAAV